MRSLALKGASTKKRLQDGQQDVLQTADVSIFTVPGRRRRKEADNTIWPADPTPEWFMERARKWRGGLNLQAMHL